MIIEAHELERHNSNTTHFEIRREPDQGCAFTIGTVMVNLSLFLLINILSVAAISGTFAGIYLQVDVLLERGSKASIVAKLAITTLYLVCLRIVLVETFANTSENLIRAIDACSCNKKK